MHHLLPHSDSCLYWCLAYIREGTSDLRIYVAVTSPNPPGPGRYNIITNLHEEKRSLPPMHLSREREVGTSILLCKLLDPTLLPQKNLLLPENSIQISQSIKLNPKNVIRETFSHDPLLNSHHRIIGLGNVQCNITKTLQFHLLKAIFRSFNFWSRNHILLLGTKKEDQTDLTKSKKDVKFTYPEIWRP